ncbi:ABC transporter ATP-binding protein [Domibacillus sp. A3M-37]|uniref:ABC transporter ATP-binding protein n=1 Tax=Domibacillus sp. A3M-37 TaxID=2962037 RepID=UPI0020B82860|nr:ABC transporter ATP-binding protein [Domibacillus sp. A3M-37]MCP3764379.1 ABC transporter ATP-binding protein [Domibacillus sp. A3M-37]
MEAVMTPAKEIATEKDSEKDAFFRVSPVLEIKDLSVSSYGGKGSEEKRLVKKVNFSIRPGEMVGLAGESGSGKSLTASAILGLLPKALRVSKGQILLQGQDLVNLPEKEMGRLRGKKIAYIFQNYQGSFTPFLKIGRQLVEALRSHDKISKPEAKKQALIWLERVKLPAERIFSSYPHQLSGGQLQRASLAAALMFKPALIIADEPTTALDVLTGEKVLDLLAELQKDLHCAVLLISHDLKHVLKRTDSMAVMYGGQIVEKGLTRSVKENPRHPYTKLLLQARPVLRHTAPEKFAAIPGEPGLIAKEGCSFAPRCPQSFEQCGTVPGMLTAGSFHWTACHAAEREMEETDA